ncbi:MAG: MFS transporter, partial [Candidatus Rokubacteria bacterium]|nr:MFS transporter [Candidatus Rokubacteria bacterium]
MDRRAAVAWTLYDFANSAFVAVIPATVYSKYYALAVVGNERGEGDFWWGLAVTTSMAIVALSAPPLGAIADHTGFRKRFLFFLTYVSVAATALMATVQKGDVLWGWLLAVVGTVGFEGAIVYYNAYLPELAPRGREGRLSAYGFAVGYLGSAVALGAALPFALAGNYPGTFLITALLFGVFAIPAFLYLPADRSGTLSLTSAVRVGFTQTQGTLRRILALPALRRFLLAYLFFEDGINTVVFFSSIFAGHTLGFTTPEVIQLYFIVQLSALAGSWLWARPTDFKGPKFVVMVTLVQWCLVVAAAYFVGRTDLRLLGGTPLEFVLGPKGQFFIVAVLAGTGLGAIQAASRAFMATLIPKGQE